MDKEKAVERMLSNLSNDQFTRFCRELRNRKKEPQIARNQVDGKSYLEITDVLVSTFDETGAVEVAAEILKKIDCNKEAAQLLADTEVQYSEPGSSNMEATGGPSSENGSRDTAGPSAGERFVDKHRTELINRVHGVADILDKLLEEKVIEPSSYDEILEIRTTQKQMRALFSGPLKSAGPRGKDVFYRILEKTEKCLIDDLKGKK